MIKNRQKAEEYAFLGQGWNFPISFNADEGSVKLVGGVEDIEQSLIILLNTLPGERVTNLGYGCKVKEKIYDPIDSKFTFLAEEAIRDAISFYESRIDVEQINVNKDQHERGLVTIEVSFIVKMTNSRHNLVYPFSELESNI